MSKETLASELEVMVPVDTALEGIQNFCDAWTNYFYDAEVLITPTEGIPANDNSLSAAKSAMESAMVANIATGAFFAIQSGVIAFWGVISTSAGVIWTAVPPPIVFQLNQTFFFEVLSPVNRVRRPWRK